MKTCPFCAEKDLQDDALVCKHCGRHLTKLKKRNSQTWGIVLVIIVPIFVFYLLYLLAEAGR